MVQKNDLAPPEVSLSMSNPGDIDDVSVDTLVFRE